MSSDEPDSLILLRNTVAIWLHRRPRIKPVRLWNLPEESSDAPLDRAAGQAD
jgi:hypothetical protein